VPPVSALISAFLERRAARQLLDRRQPRRVQPRDVAVGLAAVALRVAGDGVGADHGAIAAGEPPDRLEEGALAVGAGAVVEEQLLLVVAADHQRIGVPHLEERPHRRRRMGLQQERVELGHLASGSYATSAILVSRRRDRAA
jgi:hypothetical protein